MEQQRDLIREDETAAILDALDRAFDGMPPEPANSDLIYIDEMAECDAVWMGKKPWEKPAADTTAHNNDHDLER